MKHLTAVLLCLLLCGCAGHASPAQPEAVPESAAVPVMAGLYDPGHPMEESHPGLVRAYPLTFQNVPDIRAIGKDVLVLSGEDKTTLTVFTGDELSEASSLTLDFLLQPEDPSFRISEDALSFFDPRNQETVLLDHRLQEVRRIAAPSGLSGTPIFSFLDNTLYYCTGWAVMAWDLESGIRRTLKELSYEKQELTALHLQDQILECRIRDNGTTTRLLLSSDQGAEIRDLPDTAVLHTGNGHYFTALSSGYQTILLFGNIGAAPELLLPDQLWQQQFYLPEDHAAVTVLSSETGTQLDYYELNTGILRSSLTLEGSQAPINIVNCKGHSIYILVRDPGSGRYILYRWDVLGQKPDPENVKSHKTAYRGKDEPDLAALEDCREYAERIGKKYGITIRIWEDSLAVQPWDYRFEAEYLAPILQKELNLLEQRLAQYPEGVLQQTKDHFADLTICLVRQIIGTEDTHSLSSATGIQFFQDNGAYVVITTGKYSEQALYHELYHVMETHILTESTALDQWESLNPAGFAYGSDQPEAYLQGQTRAFIDRYSMGYPKEDRARVLENAMLSGKEEVFRSEYMQRKLRALCIGLREAYRLTRHPSVLPWEKYLVTPLVSEA